MGFTHFGPTSLLVQLNFVSFNAFLSSWDLCAFFLAPAYCGIRIFLLYVQMAKCLRDGCEDRLPDALVRRLEAECHLEVLSWFAATRADLYKIMDIILNKSFWRDRPLGR